MRRKTHNKQIKRKKTKTKYFKKQFGGTKFEKELKDIIENMTSENKSYKQIREALYTHFSRQRGRAIQTRNREILNKILEKLNFSKNENFNNTKYATKKGKYESYLSHPEIYDREFYKKINMKKEFFENRNDELQDRCNNQQFKLSPHQQLLANFMNPNTPYKSLLLFHGTGTGKTCTAISIAETFREQVKEYGPFIIICGKSIIDNFKSNLFDKNKLSEDALDYQCVGRWYYDETDLSRISDISKAKSNEEKDKIHKQITRAINRKIEEYYDFNTYYQFAKPVYDKRNNAGYLNYIRNNFSNKVIIVDEVHSIRMNEQKKGESIEEKKILQVLIDIAKHAIGTRLILLSATPMYDNAREYISLLNLLRINDNKSTVKENEIFDKQGNLINADLLKASSVGYISYVRSEDPINFPLRDNTHRDNRYINPGIDFFGIDIQDLNNFEELGVYCIEAGRVQKEVLLDYQKNNFIAENRTGIRIHEEEILKQMSLIVYPNRTFGKRGLNTNFEMDITRKHTLTGKDIKVNQYKYTNLDNGEFLRLEHLNDYSPKFYDTIQHILHFIQTENGIIFVFCSEVIAGILPFCLALEQNGFDRYDSTELLNKRDLSKIDKVPWKEGEREIAKYIVVTGKESQSKRNNEIRDIKHKDNIYGKNIRIIIGSQTMSEGIDLKWVRQIHILDPWYNLNRIEQIIGRGIRFCSHKEYPKKDRNVKIFLHAIAPMEDIEDTKLRKGKVLRDTSDIYLYKVAWNKSKQIGIVEKIMKESAIDCTFHKNTNVLDTDKPYSKICNYSEECNYNCFKPELPNKSKVNKDTYKIEHSKNKTDQCLTIIKQFFFNHTHANFQILLTVCSKHLNMDPKEIIDIVSHSLNLLVEGEKNIKNKVTTGKIKYRKGYYIFQELGGDDDPIFYRNRKTLKRRKHNTVSLDNRRVRDEFHRIHRKGSTERKTLSKSKLSDKTLDELITLLVKQHENRKKIHEYLSERVISNIIGREMETFVDELILDRLTFNQLIEFLPKLFTDNSPKYHHYREYFVNSVIDNYIVIFNDTFN